MNKILKIAACVAAFSSCAAHAEVIDFSYTFGLGQGVITGTLDGDLVNGVAENISNVQASFFGQFVGPLSVGSYSAAAGGFVSGGATISTTASANNFLFVDSNDIPNFEGFTNYFAMSAGAPGVFGGQVVAVNANTGPAASDDALNGSWSLKPAPVPLPAALLLLPSGLGLFGALARRGRKA